MADGSNGMKPPTPAPGPGGAIPVAAMMHDPGPGGTSTPNYSSGGNPGWTGGQPGDTRKAMISNFSGTLNPSQQVAFASLRPPQQQALASGGAYQPAFHGGGGGGPGMHGGGGPGGAPGGGTYDPSVPHGYNVDNGQGGSTFLNSGLYSALYGNPQGAGGMQSTPNWDQWKDLAGGPVPFVGSGGIRY